jgi:hypothetical protein
VQVELDQVGQELAASTATAMARPASAATIVQRRSNRSLRTPPAIVTRSRGTKKAMPTTERAAGEL